MRIGLARLAGFRLIRTNLAENGLNRNDTTNLLLHRLDLVAALDIKSDGLPGDIAIAHVSPDVRQKEPIHRLAPILSSEIDINFTDLISGLEQELRRSEVGTETVHRENRALLLAINTPKKRLRDEDILEMKELARSAGLKILDSIVQHRNQPDPKYCIGEGKIEEVSLRAIQYGVEVLLFQQNLSPNQARHLFGRTELKVIDRTQLILDIFAQRAKSHDGKLQVELAQLRYALPRLKEKESMLSRLVGGIGGRGPGETTLEIHRRRARDRMNRLEKEIESISRKRSQKRTLRGRREVPVVSIVGYTNAGKSTLLNALTGATALVEDKLFATLDPFSKRLRFPKERELILTDTVGFIRDLPPDLIKAFRATLEEIGEADVLIHVVDASNEHFEKQIQSVNELLKELGYSEIPQILVLNKQDRVNPSWLERISQEMNAVPISALNQESTRQLLARLESALWAKTS